MKSIFALSILVSISFLGFTSCNKADELSAMKAEDTTKAFKDNNGVGSVQIVHNIGISKTADEWHTKLVNDTLNCFTSRYSVDSFVVYKDGSRLATFAAAHNNWVQHEIIGWDLSTGTNVEHKVSTYTKSGAKLELADVYKYYVN